MFFTSVFGLYISLRFSCGWYCEFFGSKTFESSDYLVFTQINSSIRVCLNKSTISACNVNKMIAFDKYQWIVPKRACRSSFSRIIWKFLRHASRSVFKYFANCDRILKVTNVIKFRKFFQAQIIYFVAYYFTFKWTVEFSLNKKIIFK